MNIIEVDVKQYVEDYNKTHEQKTITRHDVYKMIHEGKLKAHKGARGKWIIELKQPEPKKVKGYSVKEFVAEYNKKHPKCIITIEEVRKMLTDGTIKGEKVNRKWIVYASPSKRIK